MGSTTVEAPAPRDIGQETSDTLSAQIALAPQQFAATSEFAPQYANLYQNVMRDTLLGTNGQGGLLSTYSQAAPAISDLQAQLNTAQRSADIADVENLGSRAVQAYNNANPQLADIRNRIAAQAGNLGNSISMLGSPTQIGFQNVSATQNPLLGQLNQSVSDQLALGGQLSPYEQAQAANAVMSQLNMYGRADDNLGIANVALNLDSVQRQRLLERQAAAAQVAGLNQTQGSQDLQAAMANQQAGLSAGQLNNQFGLQYGLANQQAQYNNAVLNNQSLFNAGNFLQQSNVDPYALILGRSNALGQTSGLSGQAGAFGTGPSSQFDPFNSYASDLYNTNYNAQASANIATANNNAGLWGGLLGGLGTIGGAIFGS